MNISSTNNNLGASNLSTSSTKFSKSNNSIHSSTLTTHKGSFERVNEPKQLCKINHRSNSTQNIEPSHEEIINKSGLNLVVSDEKKGRSKKLLNQWKQAASMSKLGNRTKNLLEKWKYSYSVDLNETHLNSPDSLPVAKSDLGSSLKGIGKSDESNPSSKGKWTEHIWSAWVHRGFSNDQTDVDTLEPGGILLSDFQKDKFIYFFFHVLDLNADNVISSEDFQKLNDRIRHYMDWSVNTVQYLVLKEVHETFLENFLNIASIFSNKSKDSFDYWDPFKSYNEEIKETEAKTCVTIDEWIDVWGILVGKAKTLSDFPMWLQCYPKVLFEIINRSGSGAISKGELKHFYTAFMDVGKLGEERLSAITNNAFNALTCDGELSLTYHVYKLSFLNFLLGKQPNGPGQYLFGTVTPRNPICSFPIDYSAMNSTEDDRELFGHDKLQKTSRRSVIV